MHKDILQKDPIKMMESINAERREKLQEIASTFFRCFSSGDGTKVLKLLKEQTLEQSCWIPQLGDMSNNFAYYREGQNALMRDIIKIIEKGRNA